VVIRFVDIGAIVDHYSLNQGLKIFVGRPKAQGFLNFFNPSPVSDLPSPNL
jgi:hypothetical protein